MSVRRLFTRSFFALAGLVAAPLACSASPVNYVRVCDAFGAAFFYIPGTDQCANASTGETRQNSEHGVIYNETGLRRNVDRALEGVAIATAIPTAIVDPGKTFAIAGNWGMFNSNQWGAFGAYKPVGLMSMGFQAVGVGAAMRVTDQLQINGSVAVGASGRSAASKLGFNYSW